MATREPIRMCLACRRRAAQPDLLRLSRGPGGRLSVEARPRRGRGAYLCPRRSCFERALRKGAVRHALRLPKGATLPSAEQVLAQARETLRRRGRLLARRDADEEQQRRIQRLLQDLPGEHPGPTDNPPEDRLTVDGARRFSKVAHRADRLGRKGGPANAHG